ncbi:MAG: prephenate dehydrogenase/arogenate dehydrogenase family protein, partial [Clostridia bacterium]|nr:prephenate dehydrogenase/arogenate dehydrogenase family protein [Clostridia bacterium]
LDAATHDQAVAVVSHLPHIAAAALSLLAMRRDDGILSRLAAGGFRDITRIASSDPNMWCEISLASKDFLLPVLKDFQALVSEFIEAVEKQDKDQLYQLFDQAALYRNSLPVNGQGTLDATSLLTVYAHDRPGALGHVTTLLSEQSVHVVNIRICEDGCLQLMLENSHQAEKAAFVLQEAGYECA